MARGSDFFPVQTVIGAENKTAGIGAHIKFVFIDAESGDRRLAQVGDGVPVQSVISVNFPLGTGAGVEAVFKFAEGVDPVLARREGLFPVFTVSGVVNRAV